MASAAAVPSSSSEALAIGSPVRSADHGLVGEQRLEPALRDLRLVGGVLGVPAGILEDVAQDHRRHQAAVVTLADERAQHLVAADQRSAARRALRIRRAAAADRGLRARAAPRGGSKSGTVCSISSVEGSDAERLQHGVVCRRRGSRGDGGRRCRRRRAARGIRGDGRLGSCSKGFLKGGLAEEERPARRRSRSYPIGALLPSDPPSAPGRVSIEGPAGESAGSRAEILLRNPFVASWNVAIDTMV